MKQILAIMIAAAAITLVASEANAQCSGGRYGGGYRGFSYSTYRPAYGGSYYYGARPGYGYHPHHYYHRHVHPGYYRPYGYGRNYYGGGSGVGLYFRF